MLFMSNASHRSASARGVRGFLSLARVQAFVLFLLFSFVFCQVSFAEPVLIFYGEEVVVTASRIPQQLSRSPWNVTVIKEGEMRTFGAESVADVLRFIPGVDIYATGGKGALSTARIKGANSSQVLVLINGCRINSPLLGSVDIGDLLLNNVEKIEVVTAPLSSVYGSDAISGVINIITKQKAEEFPMGISLSLGSYSAQKGELFFGNEAFLFTALYDKTNGFRTNSDYLGQNYSLSKTLRTRVGEIRLGTDYYTANRGVPGVPNAATDPTSASTPDNRQQDANLNLFLEYDKAFSQSNLSAKLYQYSTDQKYHEYNFTTTTFSDSTYKTSQVGFNLQNDWGLRESGILSLGFECRGDNGESSNIGNRSINDWGAYINSEMNQGPLTLSVGVRGDSHSIVGSCINPRVGMSIRPSPDIKFWANIATAYKAPTLNDLYWNDPIWLMYGDENLSPEQSVGIQIGMDKTFSPQAVFAMSLFARQVTDQILWEFDPNTFIYQAKNVGRVEVSGLDAKYNVSVGDGLDVFANTTFQIALDKEDTSPGNIGKDIPYSPRRKANLGINWRNPLGRISVLVKHVGESYFDAGNTHKLDAYTVTDLSYRRQLGQMNFSARVGNLFNVSYAEAAGCHPVTYAILDYPMPGRSFSFGFTLYQK
ncbi:MAG: TonB-dependent receptor [Candidatus Saganbacteria bacterium]|nr:TonB-dependent receptor [Candidatus Saganbacteria bacterium]